MICRHSVASRLGYTVRNRLQVTRAFINPYKVLQVSEDADPSQIKRAYRKLALRHHPDINEEPSAEQDFLKIQEAYEILTHKREDSQANPNNNGWDFHDWYWDFTMSHRWDSHWKKHGRTGPSPFAATPSHRQQWQAQLSKLKQKAAYRRAQQQATHQTEQAGDQQHWSPRHQSQPSEQTQDQYSREQEEQIPERHLEGHQQAVHAERLDSQPRHDHRDWLASHGWKEDHHQATPAEVHPAAVGHAPSYQYSQSQAVQQHAAYSQMPTPSCKEHSTGDSPDVSPQALEPESYLSSDQSSGVLAVLLTHQLLQHLQQHGHSLEWAVKQNSMMGAAMQHVQSPLTILHRNSQPDASADAAEDASADATADVVTHRISSHFMPSHPEMPAPQEQASAHEQASACTPRNSVPASDKGKVAVDEQSYAAGPSHGSAPFQTQQSQVQSQLAGLKRRAARKNAA